MKMRHLGFIVLMTMANLVLVLAASCIHANEAKRASCIFDPSDGTGGVSGRLELSQLSESSPLYISGSVSGVQPNSALHGFHVHAEGQLGDQCKDAKGHYNPLGVNHGAPDAKVRHVGDLGNVRADVNGVVAINVVDRLASLFGDFNVANRAIVLHEGEDDLGLGGDEGSIASGNAGARIGCCRIEPKV